jgi:ribose transport system permease protein
VGSSETVAAPPPADADSTLRRLHISPTGAHTIAITLVAVILFATFSAFAPHFASLSNVYSMAQVSSYTFVVAAGLTFLFIAAEIDLSVGSIVAFTSVIMALLVANHGVNPWLAALAAVVTGALIGAVNGFVVSVVGVQSFIVTLGMLSILGGGSLVITGGLPVDYPSDLHSSLFTITNGSIHGFPAAVLWALGIFVVAETLLRYTTFGYHVYAVGGNRNAAREMGVSVRWTKFTCFVITGGLCGLTAVLESNWLQEADPGSGSTFTLETIAAIIVGGVALYGGSGSVYGTLIGTIIIGMLGNGLVLLGLNSAWPQLVEGLMIIVVVTLGLGVGRLRRGGENEQTPAQRLAGAIARARHPRGREA